MIQASAQVVVPADLVLEPVLPVLHGTGRNIVGAEQLEPVVAGPRGKARGNGAAWLVDVRALQLQRLGRVGEEVGEQGAQEEPSTIAAAIEPIARG
jgi:hypothetical protein